MQRGTMVVAVGITVVRAVEVGATFFVLTASVSLFHLMSILVPSVQVDHARNQTSPNGKRKRHGKKLGIDQNYSRIINKREKYNLHVPDAHTNHFQTFPCFGIAGYTKFFPYPFGYQTKFVKQLSDMDMISFMFFSYQ